MCYGGSREYSRALRRVHLYRCEKTEGVGDDGG